MNSALLTCFVLLFVLSSEALAITLLVSVFLKHTNKIPIPMTDILYLLASIGFFALMLVFIWACEKV